jgi:hypothetical protein
MKAANHWGWIVVALVGCFWLIFPSKPNSPPAPPTFKKVVVNFQDPQDASRFSGLTTAVLEAYGFSSPGGPADAVIDISTRNDGEEEDPIHVTTLQADFTLSGGEIYRQDSCVGIMPGEPDSPIRITAVAPQFKKDHRSITRVFVEGAETDKDPALLALVTKELEEKGFQLVADKTQAQAVLTKLKAHRHVIHVMRKPQTLMLNLYAPAGAKDFRMQSTRTARSVTTARDADPKRTRLCAVYLHPYLAVTAPQLDEEFLRILLPALKYIDERNHSSQ